MLLGHTDVVAAEPEHWTHPPFSGALADGCVWGRGALDMKNMVAANLMVLLLLQRESVRLNRDIIFAATADEEAGKGNHGPGWIIDNRPDLWDAPLIITEGGGSDFAVGEQRFYTCQTGQKGLCRLRLIARGTPGHGSMPHGDSAIVKLSRALAGLAGAAFPAHMSASVRRFVEGIASRRPAPRPPFGGKSSTRQPQIPRFVPCPSAVPCAASWARSCTTRPRRPWRRPF